MYSGYSGLTSKMYLRSSPPYDDSQRFGKVSPVGEEAREDASGTAEDRVNGENLDYRWKNRFSGVSQYKPQPEEPPTSAHGTSDTYFSTSSESATSKYLADTLSSSPTPEERVISGSQVHLRHDYEPAAGRRGWLEWEEPGAPAAQQREGREAERTESRRETQQLPTATLKEEEEEEDAEGDEDDSSRFTGVFQATWVELDSAADPVPPPPTPPASPDIDSPNQFDMESLVDTLKSMGPSGLRQRSSGSFRSPAPNLVSSLPPIVEDTPSPITQDVPDAGKVPTKPEANSTAEAPNGFYSLPPELGLRGTLRDTRSPLEMMKHSQKVGTWIVIVKQFFMCLILCKFSNTTKVKFLSTFCSQGAIILQFFYVLLSGHNY